MDRPLDPPVVIQVMTIYGEWTDALLLGWDLDSTRGWMAVVVMRRYASEVRPQQVSRRPDVHNSMRRKGWKGPLPYKT